MTPEEQIAEIRAACEEYLAYLRGPEYHEDGMGDYENVIFETALETIMGKHIWDEINAIMDRWGETA